MEGWGTETEEHSVLSVFLSAPPAPAPSISQPAGRTRKSCTYQTGDWPAITKQAKEVKGLQDCDAGASLEQLRGCLGGGTLGGVFLFSVEFPGLTSTRCSGKVWAEWTWFQMGATGSGSSAMILVLSLKLTFPGGQGQGGRHRAGWVPPAR